MLHEIFKGMDNAAELINENFESVKIKHGQNEKGSYVVLGNGLKVAWFTITKVHTGSTYQWDYPIEFSNPPTVMATANQSTDSRSYSGVKFGVTTYADHAALRKWDHGSLNYPFHFIAIGY